MYNEFAIGLTVSSYIFATILMILLVSAAAAIIIKQPRVITGKEQLTQLQNP